jgi:hypothetical protein
MPASARGITFNADGVCQLCGQYVPYVPRGEAALRREIEPYLAAPGDFNCIVPVSGGRDSSYALYYVTKVLGLKPLAVHNDNDFETEVATRNLQTITQRLDVPLIRVGSRRQLGRKVVTEKIKMNAPFGAGLVVDQICEACQIGFESAAYSIAKKNGIALIFWGDSREESTASYHKLIKHTNPSRMQRLLSPCAVNLLAYKFYIYQMHREYGAGSSRGLKEMHLYDYVRWDQEVIVRTIREHLGWSVPEDSPTTWRVDCSLVPMVNYLTERAYGVSKIELGFSTMIRHGKMDREDALRRVELIRQHTDPAKLKDMLSAMGISSRDIGRIIN